MSALTAVKSADIAGVVSSLNSEQLDVLAKYLYCGMGSPEKFNSGVLLAWHEKALFHFFQYFFFLEKSQEVNKQIF